MLKNSKTVLVISAFFSKSNNCRSYIITKCLSEQFIVARVVSNFLHTEKKKVSISDDNIHVIKTMPYSKNLSFKRIISHIKFALDVQKFLKTQKPDLVYVCIPPNIMGFLLTAYCRKQGIKIICDILDLWPEAIPAPRLIKKLFDNSAGVIWKYFRSYSIAHSDYIITESKYFFDKLNLYRYENAKFISLKSDTAVLAANAIKSSNILTIAYLGNMGRIYDFDSLIEIASHISKKRELKVVLIGDGEKREYLLKALSNHGINYIWHGIVYDLEKKKEILSESDYGFNGYKENTEVALSYKSIEYLSYGCILINSAKGDTWNYVNEYGIGFNYSSSGIPVLVEQILNQSKESHASRRIKALNFFDEKLSYKTLKIEMNDVMKKLNID